MRDLVVNELKESASLKIYISETLTDKIVTAAEIIVKALQQNKKILLIGNGGSAADAQHIAAELVGKFKSERRALAAIALTTDTSILTALGNDYGIDIIFSRQIEALGEENDVLIAISTSGTSKNIIKAVEVARKKKITVIGLTGNNGGTLKDLADYPIIVPSNNTPRIQEAHITIGHIICNLIERMLFYE